MRSKNKAWLRKSREVNKKMGFTVPVRALAFSSLGAGFLWFMGFPKWAAFFFSFMGFLRMGGFVYLRMIFRTFPTDLW